MTYTIVGVIGHIDHGKTSLVAALTGVNTDTDPEEQRRGITIDLGFASFTDAAHTFALVDAPGHQKYIGNLLVGVSGIDLGLLVVAADQGIQAQTLEHAAILQSLGVRQLIVVISRIDLSEPSRITELSEELDLFLADFGFHQIPKVSVSTVTRQGLDELRALLVSQSNHRSLTKSSYFRLPIDRVLTIPGRGTVVAGIPWSGSVAIGDQLELARTGGCVRVREIEVHGTPQPSAEIGKRTAINVVDAEDLQRGDELVSGGTHHLSSRLLVDLKMFRDASELRLPITVQLHTATTSTAARLTGVKRIPGGDSAVVLVNAATPIVATHGQACLFRCPYPVGSFAGGRVLAALGSREQSLSKPLDFGRRLVAADAVERLAAWVDFVGELECNPVDLELRMGIAAPDQQPTIAAAVTGGLVQLPIAGWLVSNQRLERMRNYLVKLVTQQAELNDNAWWDIAALSERARGTGSRPLVRWMIDQLIEQQQLVRVNHRVAIASAETVLSKKQRARMDQILAIFAGSRTPPTAKELAALLQTTLDVVESLVRIATQHQTLIDIGGGFLLSRAVFVDIVRELRSLYDMHPAATVAQIRDHLGITRKHAIPLLEYCDQIGVTQRTGDERAAGVEIDRILATHGSGDD